MSMLNHICNTVYHKQGCSKFMVVMPFMVSNRDKKCKVRMCMAPLIMIAKIQQQILIT
jgi:hypothetical protein